MVFVLVLQVRAQSGALAGRVLDSAGAPISGAHVTAVPRGGTAGNATDSTPDGRFSLVLEPGSYTVKVAKEGFKEASRDVVFPASVSSDNDIMLQVAPVIG